MNNLRIFAYINTVYDRVHYLPTRLPYGSMADTLLLNDSRQGLHGMDFIYNCRFGRSGVHTAVQKIYQ